MAWWLIIPMIDETTGLFLEGYSGGWMFHSIGGSVGSSTKKGSEFFHISSKTWWEEVRAAYNGGIIILPNSSTAFSNTLILNSQNWNNYMEIGCIIVVGRCRTKIMRYLTWSCKCSWGSSSFKITKEFTCVDRKCLLLSRNVMISFILGTMNTLSLLLFENSFMYWDRSLVGETYYPDWIISCWSLRTIL